jgi:hypothetical protein
MWYHAMHLIYDIRNVCLLVELFELRIDTGIGITACGHKGQIFESSVFFGFGLHHFYDVYHFGIVPFKVVCATKLPATKVTTVGAEEH